MKKHLLLFLLTLFTLALPAAAVEKSYTISFKDNGNNSDGSALKTALADIVASGTEYVSGVETATKIYLGKSGYGLKLGSGSGNGVIALNLSDLGKVNATKITVSAAKYGSDTGTLTINGKTGYALSSTLSDITLDLDGSQIETLSVATSAKRGYVASITVYYEEGEATEPVAPTALTFDPEGGDIEATTPITISVDAAADPACTIEYSIDGADYVAYTSAFTLTPGSHTVTAKAWNTANADAPLTATATYNVAEPEKFNGYTIVFKNGTGNDSSTAYTASTSLATVIEEGAEYVSHITSTNNVYSGKAGYGMKFGSSSKAGAISFALAPEAQVKASKVVIKAATYGSDSSSLSFAGKTQTLTSSDLTDYTFELDGTTLTDLTLSITGKRGYIKAVTVYAAEEEEVPSKPVITFEPASGTYAYNTPVTITVENAESDDVIEITKLIADGDNLDVTPLGNGKYTFNLTADVDFEVVAMSADAEMTTAEASYIVKRPEAPVLNPAGGEVKKGTKVTVSMADGNAYMFEYDITTESGEGDEEVLTDEVKSFDFTVNEYTLVSVKALLPNGYEGPVTEAEYTVAIPKAPEAPVFSVVEGAVREGSTTAITSVGADKIYVATYAIDGELGAFEEYTEPMTIDKMNRRFVAYAENETGTSDLTEAFYSISAAKEGYVLVKSENELYDGMEFVFGSYNSISNPTTFYTMANTSNNYSRLWDAKEGKCDDDVITEPGENVMYLVLKSAGEGKWYIMTRDEVTFKVSGSKNDVTTAIGYFKSGGNNNYLYMDTKVSDDALATIAFEEGGAKITFGSITDRWLCYNNNNKVYSCYTNTSYPLVGLYAKQSGGATGGSAAYTMTIHHTPVMLNGQGSAGDDNPIVRIASADHTNATEMEAVENEDGSTTYTATVQNLQGQFVLNLEGIDLAGHIDQAKTDFHAHQTAESKDPCDDEHAPYVYVGDGQALKLVAADNEKAVPLSTNPNEYHGMTEHHANSTVSVNFTPFVGATMAVSAPDGTVTAVANINVDAPATTDTYYNLQGIRMDGRTLAPGVYIRVNGNQVTKTIKY